MKSLLIATTALVSVFSLTPAAGQPARQAASDHYPLDANREFLCNYGFAVSTLTSASSAFVSWRRAATPVIGNGKTVTEIIVADAPLESTAHPGFSVAIYSSLNDTFKGLASATTGQSKRCERIKVPISPTRLAKGKKYWIVETARAPPWRRVSTINSMLWLYDKRSSSSGAFWQSGLCSSISMTSCWSRTRWQSITGGVPYAKVK